MGIRIFAVSIRYVHISFDMCVGGVCMGCQLSRIVRYTFEFLQNDATDDR